MRAAFGSFAVILVLASSLSAWAACGDAPDDAAQLAAARAQVATDCDCAEATSHATFVRCAVGVANDRMTGGLLLRARARSGAAPCARPVGAQAPSRAVGPGTV